MRSAVEVLIERLHLLKLHGLQAFNAIIHRQRGAHIVVGKCVHRANNADRHLKLRFVAGRFKARDLLLTNLLEIGFR